MTNPDLTKRADLTRHGRGTGALRTRRPEYVDFLPPCNDACPAGENIQAWLALAQTGDFEGAWRELVRNNPMPSMHGRVCYHPCEDVCNRAFTDSAVSIHAVERYLGDLALEKGWQVRRSRRSPSGKKILIVGADPSGLSAAYHLTSARPFEVGDPRGGAGCRRHDPFRHPGLPHAARRTPGRDRAHRETSASRSRSTIASKTCSPRRKKAASTPYSLRSARTSARRSIFPAREAGKILDAVSFLSKTKEGERTASSAAASPSTAAATRRWTPRAPPNGSASTKR